MGKRPRFLSFDHTPPTGKQRRPLSFAPAPHRPPRWPGAYALARAGSPIGVCSLPYGDGATIAVAVIDTDGVLWQLARLRPYQFGPWCIARHVRWYPALGPLVSDLKAGFCVGWVHDTMIEVDGDRRFSVVAEPLRASARIEDVDHDTAQLL